MSTGSARGWPPLPWTGSWPATQSNLRLVTQMMGKLRLALSPIQPEWFHTSLAVGARGLTTGALASGDRSVEVTLDLVDHVLAVLTSDGETRRIALLPSRPIAEIWADYVGALRDLGMDVEMWDKPQEVADHTRLSQDRRDRTYDPDSVTSWITAMTAIRNVFDEWRSPFFGRTSVQFWWGGFDLTVVAFNGRHSTPPAGAGYIKRYDVDAELVCIGFWPGNRHQEAMFFAYIMPEPAGCALFPLDTPPAAWAPEMGEWVLPYEAVRTAPDPRATLLAFMDAAYAATGKLAGWDSAAFRYVRPPRIAPDSLREAGIA